MKVAFDPRHLKEAMSAIIGVVSRNPGRYRAMLRHCKIQCRKNKTTIFASNLEAWVSVNIRASMEREGDALVEIDRLDRIASVATGEVVVDVDGNGTRVLCGRSSWKFATEDPKEYPPHVAVDPVVTFPGEKLFFDAIRKAHVACDRESSRAPALEGVHVRGPELVVEASDGRRLFYCGQLACVDSFDFGVSIPARYAAAVARQAESWSGDVEIGVANNFVWFRGDGVWIQVPVLEGKFPNTAHILGLVPTTVIYVKPREMLAALAAVAMTAGDDENNTSFLIVTLKTAAGLLRFETRRSAAGEESFTEIPCEGAGGDETLGWFQLPFLRDALASFDGDTAELRFSDWQKGEKSDESQGRDLEIRSSLWLWRANGLTREYQ